MSPPHAQVDGGIEQPVCVLVNKGVGEGGELAAGRAVEKAGQPEIVKADAPIIGNEEVARMRIAVEDAKHEDLVQVGVDEALCQLRPFGLEAGVIDAAPAAALLDDDGLGDKAVNDAGDIDCGPICKGNREPADVLGLPTEIALLSEVRPDLVDDVEGPVVTEPGHQAFGHPRNPGEGAHVAVDLNLDLRPPDLDDNIPPVVEAGRMDLGHRRCG
jgi:hypothetical protein